MTFHKRSIFTAGPRLGLIDGGLIAEPCEEVGAGKPRRPGSDDGDLASGILRALADVGKLDRHLLVDHESLGSADRDRLVERRPPALVLA